MVLPKKRGDLVAVFLALTGLYWFTASFFLAKRSLSKRSSCHEAATLLRDTLGLNEDEIRQTGIVFESATNNNPQGCWMNRTVDSLVILVVDALRFDFAYYNLPKSVGRRLHQNSSQSRLFQFVADPPTVTMQRLKALTTGGLPTFADISANFGGAVVEEDSWVEQMVTVDPISRGSSTKNMGFVGDDTWQDLFPGRFAESHPYPSFNTRDMDTVDNGCLKHIPDMLTRIRKKKSVSTEDPLEILVVHFLGVDHVGHTYGPHNKHMDAKLKQMDDALVDVLDKLDASDSCHTTFIFGDHGMTQDGNHGGGTLEETHAALFVHSSIACKNPMQEKDSSSLQLLLEGPTSTSDLVQEAAFSSIHQIDLVSTISMALGLPIPYANLGSFVPSLLPDQDIRHTVAALALNAAQVWRYLTVYSATANKLPNLAALGDKLEMATTFYKEALSVAVVDPDSYQRVASLYKMFLRQALELGQRVWTRFDMAGMIGGIVVLGLGLLLYTVQSMTATTTTGDQKGKSRSRLFPPPAHYWELLVAIVFMVYQCGLLTFSNSYILEEEHSIMFSLSILSGVVAFRLWSDPVQTTWAGGVLLIPIAARLNELLVSGHGSDPSIRLHGAHHSLVFLTCLGILGLFRWRLYQKRYTDSLSHAAADCLALLCLAGSWWEKRSIDPDRNGFVLSQIALALLFCGIPLSVFQALTRDERTGRRQNHNRNMVHKRFESDMLTCLSKLLIAIMSVTGPATATSLVLYSVQAIALYVLSSVSSPVQVHSIVLAALWKLITRYSFFVTNHGCAFNRLQYSAAFTATKEFYFVTGGISLFLNTFGWEVAGLAFAWLMSHHQGRKSIWRIYAIYQLIEAVFSCISVTVLRRHLMVWDIYAPHFLFSAIFSVLTLLSQLTATILVDH
jgi:phosphatidylinositol glycan class O